MTSDEIPFEHPDDKKPVSKEALRERKRAIREGRLIAPPRDELAEPVEPEVKPEVEPEVGSEGEPMRSAGEVAQEAAPVENAEG